jgi:hypothetical protein
MPSVVSFAGPVQVSFSSDCPLPLTLSGQLRGVQGVNAIVSFDSADKPELPTDLRDADVEVPADHAVTDLKRPPPQIYWLRAAGKDYQIPAHRVFVHRDLSVLMQNVVPPQPVSSAYRWRWRLGIFLARIPILRGWLG